MPERYAKKTGSAGVPYRIVTRGHLSHALVGPLGRLEVETVDSDEVALLVDIVDQAQLQGVLGWLSDLGVEIKSVNALDEPDDDP